MKIKYKPKYAFGQILVEFKSAKNEQFAREFGKTLGYEMANETYEHGTAFIYKTKRGEEKTAINQFEKYPEFVNWADRRDIGLESRWNGLESTIRMLQEIADDAEQPDTQYNNNLDKVITSIQLLKQGTKNKK